MPSLPRVPAETIRARLPALAVVWLVLSPASASAPPSDPQQFDESWRWRQFTVEAGLPSNYVHDVVETAAGTLWASTAAGLAWYDGYLWHPVPESEGLPSGRVDSAVLFGRDELMVETAGQLYHGNRHGFRPLVVGLDGESPRIATSLPETGAVLLAVQRAGVMDLVYRHKDGRLERLDTPSPPAPAEDPQVWSTASGALWVNTLAGLYRRKDERWSMQLEAPDGMQLTITRLVENFTGAGLVTVVYPPQARGLWEWSAGGAPARRGENRLHLFNGMDMDPAGEVLVVYGSGDIQTRVGGEWASLDRPPRQMTNVLFVRFRADGDLWVGTKSGLFLLRRSDELWKHWTSTAASLWNLILEILPANDGSVWIGTGKGILIRRPDGSLEEIEAIQGMTLNEVTGLAQDRHGHIWASSGSSFAGAYRWDGREWRHFGVEDGLPARRVHKIRPDRRGDLWFLGLARVLDPAPGEVEPGAFRYVGDRFEPWGTHEGLPSGRVYAFAESSDGTRWFGTLGGLSRWRDGEWTHWTTEQGLASDKVFALAVDAQDRLWFAHQVSGLGFLEGDRPSYVTTADGLISDEVWDLLADSDGALWISSRGGLCLHRDGILSCFDRSSGLSNENLWPIRLGDDKIYVGTLGNGVNVLDLKLADHRPPRVSLTAPVVEGAAVLLRWRAHAYWGETFPSDVETRYRDGEGPWSPWSTLRERTLTGLPSGGHDFQVQGKGRFGDVVAQPATVSFTIVPPLYRRLEFVLPLASLLAAVIGLAGILLARRRKHAAALSLQESERELRELSRRLIQAREEERRRLARELHDDLNQRLAFLAMQLQRLGQSPPDSSGAVSSQARTLWEQTTEICADVQRLAYQLHPSKLEELGLVTAARSFCEEVGEQTGIRVHFLERNVPRSLPSDVALCLYRVMQESLGNVAKHSRATEAEVNLSADGASVRLRVSDSGIGFDLEAARTRGLGLLSMRERLQLLGGNLVIRSAAGAGTSIEAMAPLPASTGPGESPAAEEPAAPQTTELA